MADQPPLAEPADVTVLLAMLPSHLRPTPTDDELKAYIDIASMRLRQKAPWVDERMGLWSTNPSDPKALNPKLVAAVIASVIRRALINPLGVASKTAAETIGPYNASETNSWVNARTTSDSTVRGEIYVTDDDVKALLGQVSGRKIGSIRVRGSLA